MIYNSSHKIHRRCWPLVSITGVIIIISLLLTSTPLLLAQSAPENYVGRAFLPVINQASATEQITSSAPPQAVCGIANVDGNAGEWNLTTDFFAPLYQAGDPNKPVLAKLYVRYDGATSTLYTLVLAEPGNLIQASDSDGQFVKEGNRKKVDGSSGDNGTVPDFAYVGRSGSTAQGWEASSTWAAGSYTNLNVHAQIIDANGQSQTSAVANRAIPITLSCPIGTASIGDRVWNDTDRDGVQDDGEVGVPNVTVQLKDCNGNVLQTTTTDANGVYRFSNLVAGCYTIGVLLPAGFVFSPQDQGGNDNNDSDINPTTGMSGPINLNAGQNIDNVDAGINQPVVNNASIGDRVWNDADRDGVQDNGEVGVPNVTVTLLSGCSGNTVVSNTSTDGNGLYGFSGLAAGQYRIQVSNLPAGFVFSPQNQGGNDANDSDVNSSGISDCITLAAGQNDPNWDAGINQPVVNNASIGDRVWNDADRDGVQDNGEVGVPNVTVTLLSGCSGNTVLSSATTDGNGLYGFSGLAAGQYRIQVSNLPAGFVFSPQNQGGNDANDSDVNSSSGISDCITLAAGQNDPNWDAGINQPPVTGSNCIGDRVWSDINRNGIQDNGEVGVAGATINVENTGGTIIGSAVTDANGFYQICNLPTNTTLFAQLIPPPGYLITSENEGRDDTVDSDFSSLNGYTGGITVPSGQNNFTVDGGLVPATASVGDRVWMDDATPNGIQDPGDPGMAGATAKLFDPNGITLATQTTDSNGNYLFTGLPAGNYYICFTPTAPPPVFIAVPQDQGGDDTLDSDMSQSNNCTAIFTLTTGANLTIDAGFVDP